MVKEQLPELEHIKCRFTESEVKKASDLDGKWNGHEDLSTDHAWDGVVLHDRRSLLLDGEPILHLES